MHDLNGGIQPNGLFWIVELHDHNFDVSRNGRRARLRVENESVLDSFVFGGPSAVPATVSFTVEWNATGEREKRGKGSTVPPTDPGAFLGNFADARSTGSFRATQLGFGFQSNPGVSTDLGWAEMGTERNGAFLR